MPELRVLFAPAEDNGYRAHLADAEGRRLGVEVLFTSFLTEDDYEDLRWYLEDYMDLPDGGAVVRAERVERSLGEWGSQLHRLLFEAPENQAILGDLLKGPAPRSLTIATREPDLLRLPWELMADEAGSLAQRLSVRRQLEQPERVEYTMPGPPKLPLRVLYIVSRPADEGFIDPRMTAKALLDALDPLGANVHVDFCRPPTLACMEEMLRAGRGAGEPYSLVHFDGHGTFLSESQIGGLCFERPANLFGEAVTDFVLATDLGDLLASHSIPLLILEACRSATIGKSTIFGSVAPSLIQAGVGSVLAMSHAVHVEATRLLLDSFYSELVRGTTIGQAVAEARKALRKTPARWLEDGPNGVAVELRDWFLPQLYQGDGDEALVPAGTEAGQASLRGFRGPATREEAGSFPPPPQFGFRGRAWELHELERRFRAGRGIVLHAMGGMGKTALATEAACWWARSGLFRDGACFLSFEQFMSAERAVLMLGLYLVGPKFEQLPAAEQRRHAIELFQQKGVLLVWDNFESALPQFNDGAAAHGGPYTEGERNRLAELFRDLTAGRGKGCLLVTCRPGDTGLPGAQRFELEGLARADGLWLLSSILRRDGLTLADPRLSRDNLEPLLRDLADHPLSLELVGPHLRTLTPEEIRADFGRLLATFQQEAPEGRNQSLLASLEFSRRHLSPAAREALPWLGLFSGGVFENILLAVSQLPSETWRTMRRELEGIVLLRVEDDFDYPFVRFHPTLGAVVTDPSLAQNPETRQLFCNVYLTLGSELDRALRGSRSRDALEFLNREEANYRAAVHWAVADHQFQAAGRLGGTFCAYLERSGRLRERDAWVCWLKDAIGQQGFTEEAVVYEQQHAWTRFTQGDSNGAVAQLRALTERLLTTTEFDPSFHLATTALTLGRVLYSAGATAQGITILFQAIGRWEKLLERAACQPWECLVASSASEKAQTELNNLAITMGDLANALSDAGQLDKALTFAERSLGIHQKLGNEREMAADYGRIASILTDLGRYEEADAHYNLALAVVCQTGDKEMEGTILQHRGGLARDQDQLESSRNLYQKALQCFRMLGNQGAMMSTYNQLGIVELEAGRLAEARAWSVKSREIAVQLKDQSGLSLAALNIGFAWQQEGEAARKRGDESTAWRHFEEARRSVEESQRIEQALGNKPDEAVALVKLAEIDLRLGNLDRAEQHALRGLAIDESLGIVRELPSDYHTLVRIAQARGDLAAAAEWAGRRDDALAEMKRRAGGGRGLTA